MSFHYPRRVKDLPSLDAESEDDYNTPIKPITLATKKPKQQEEQDSNKENEVCNQSNFMLGSGTKTNSAQNSLRMYPKRSSELPTLESDSEEEENNLNCAILNDSFIINEHEDISTSPKRCSDPSGAKATQSGPGDSFVLNFDRMVLNSNIKKPQNDELRKVSSITENVKGSDSQKVSQKLESAPAVVSSAASKPNNDIRDLETPFKSKTSNELEVNYSTNVPPNETHFVTPQVRSFSVRRRPRDLCSTQSQKARQAIVNEFRSQKVLFQTPMAVSRAPLPCTSNDSITLSLCDTINEVNSAPSTAEKPNPTESEKVTSSKFKKSLEENFNATEKKSVTSTESSSPNESKPKETILNINNAEYAILKKLGSGGSSSVYLACRKDNNTQCALKVVDLHGDPLVVQGYLNETKLLAKLQGNICVVTLYTYELLQKESRLYMIMEKGDSDLQKILQTYTTSLPLYVLMNFLYQMLQAVNYIHQNGVIHSDLKPANFLMVNGRLKLIDFGIASNIAIDSTSIIKFSQAGTFNYISPEALTDTSTGTSPMRNNQPKIKISTKSDVWSLGCILYLLLYKRTPFSHIKNIYAKINAICSPTTVIEYPTLAPYYPVMLLNMVQKCLRHNPKERPSCAELLQSPFNMVIPIQNLAVPKNQS